ncbi:hypothetical protein D3C73_1329960 [compost metagenome]
MQGLALVLEDLLPRHVLGIEHAAFGRAVHVLHQVTRQGAGQQRILLLDKGAGRGIGQVFDGLAAQDRQFAPPRILRAEQAIGLRQIVAHQVQ